MSNNNTAVALAQSNPTSVALRNETRISAADVREALDKIAKAGKKATLHDHIMRHLNPSEYRDYRNAVTSMKSELRNNNRYTKLLGSLVFPSHYSGRGPRGSWAGSAPAMADTLALPDFTTSNQTLRIRTAIEKYGNTIVSQNGARAISQLRGRKGDAMIDIIENIINNTLGLTTELKLVNQQLDAKTVEVDELKTLAVASQNRVDTLLSLMSPNVSSVRATAAQPAYSTGVAAE